MLNIKYLKYYSDYSVANNCCQFRDRKLRLVRMKCGMHLKLVINLFMIKLLSRWNKKYKNLFSYKQKMRKWDYWILLNIAFSFCFSGPREPDDSRGSHASRIAVCPSCRDAVYDLKRSSASLPRLSAVCQSAVCRFVFSRHAPCRKFADFMRAA